MAVSPKIKQIVWNMSGGCCAFADCRKRLVRLLDNENEPQLLGEVAHIVAEKTDGPRGDKPIPGGDRGGYLNLMLLCQEHHSLIDNNEKTYIVEKLVQIKKDHEEWVAHTLSEQQKYDGLSPSTKYIDEAIYSCLMPLSHFPAFIYISPCALKEKDVKDGILTVSDPKLLLPYIIRGGNLISFNKLDDEDTPFRQVIDPYSSERHSVTEWLKDNDQSRWVRELLNRTLNKLTGRLGLMWDKDHRRYYFPCQDEGQDREIRYNAPSGNMSTRKVAWRPVTKLTGEPKKHMKHLAVALQFHQVAEISWCLSIRPELRFTKDGYESVYSKTVGSRVTKSKSRMYNIDYLKEVHFWRDFLLNGSPRINLKFGEKNGVVIESDLINSEIRWPEVKGDARNIMHVEYQDDLLSLAELSEFEDSGEEEECWLEDDGDNE